MKPNTVQWQKNIVRLGVTETVWHCFIGCALIGRVVWTKQTKYKVYNSMRGEWIVCRDGKEAEFTSLVKAKAALLKDIRQSFTTALKGKPQ